MTLRAVSYGGGVQSTALLVLAAQRRIEFPTFLMANVGDDSEFGIPLRDAVDTGQELLPMIDEDTGCDSGWCMT